MPASEAQVRANQANAQKSTGPKTAEGKDVSRTNSLKHGLTATKIIPEREAGEVERRYVAFCEELQPSGEVGMALARQAAMLSVRTERCFEHENAILAERVREAKAEFVAPEGADEATVAKLREEAGKRALFDASPEAVLARKYEESARRGFFRALKELRQVVRDRPTPQVDEFDLPLGSFDGDSLRTALHRQVRQWAGLDPTPAVEPKVDRRLVGVDLPAPSAHFDVPISIGKSK